MAIKMKKCPSCDALNENNARYCEKCGYFFADKDEENKQTDSSKAENEERDNNEGREKAGDATGDSGAGASAGSGSEQSKNEKGFEQKAKAMFDDFNNTADTTADYDKSDIENNKVYSIFAYLGLLVLIPLLAAPNSKFARFHTNQGLVLLIAGAVYGAISFVLGIYADWLGWFFEAFIKLALWVPNILLFILVIIGIVNVVNGKAKELPIIGKIELIHK